MKSLHKAAVRHLMQCQATAARQPQLETWALGMGAQTLKLACGDDVALATHLINLADRYVRRFGPVD
jgi:hypothetical protein